MKNEPSYYKDIRKNHIRVFLLCLCGILINYVLSKLAIILKLPIWLDTAGTILAGIYGGYLPGIFTGFVTNLLKGITDFSSIYYAVLNVLIAVISTLLYKSGFLKKWYNIPSESIEVHNFCICLYAVLAACGEGWVHVVRFAEQHKHAPGRRDLRGSLELEHRSVQRERRLQGRG